MAKLTILCQLNGGCMGCCGHDFVSKGKIKEAVLRNTKEFKEINSEDKKELLQFRNRARENDLRFGVCRNLIELDGVLFCPLHPALNQEDLREGHCDVDHLCKTALEFAKWNKAEQKRFLLFVKSKKLDNLDYSLMMDNNLLLEEFD
ncbi:MAG: hypothetical protein KKH52_01900 [Nanoarchaeota archaeon]|nr:hypothetical protein [Nanoarchaeota archaeon]MBU1621975.1 hypothetical protein [Nanoarchaeota archaeon]MBU1974124.1 hypothetical protein [Nanoarchaeota archaeon]